MRAPQKQKAATNSVLEASGNPLIPCGLYEIGFVSFFFSLLERDAGLRSFPLQNSDCVKCFRWAMNDWPPPWAGERESPPCAIVVYLFKSRRPVRAPRLIVTAGFSGYGVMALCDVVIWDRICPGLAGFRLKPDPSTAKPLACFQHSVGRQG